MPAASPGAGPVRGVRDLLLGMAGLLIWAGHFTVIYAGAALACARGWAEARPFGVPALTLVVGVATLAALLGLARVLRATWPAMRQGAPDEGGEAEPRFSRWFAATATLYAIVAVLIQAMPVLFLPSCA
ncbi:hypothetical protein M0638_24350 [Roseomonas sp. NAR14]|uniref:Uncharacterized protein n=1 Tax=Roseomonas acroporae TaxID=2937791 RepID=A0A9X1YCZ2_9PROT|nr:hypothetical protein [Roseomonas acroporae]MCK8787507.1 hypothetical protein [Roseomonas acroporae]